MTSKVDIQEISLISCGAIFYIIIFVKSADQFSRCDIIPFKILLKYYIFLVVLICGISFHPNFVNSRAFNA